MQVCVFTEPHRGATYEEQLRFARLAEQAGFAGFFRADHYQQFGSGSGLPGPTDAWATLAALARETTRIRLGTLVTSSTFRLPGPLAITVAQVDQMSNGRIEFGIGAGWYEREHQAYGIAFPPLSERLDRLTEQLEVVTGLWRTPVGGTFSYQGTHYNLVDAPGLPKPAQPGGPPVIIGGRGLRRTPVLAARFADEFNAAFQSPAEAARRFRAVEEQCDRLGRRADGRPMLLSGGAPVAIGRTKAEATRRFEAVYEPNSALPPHEDPVVGSPEQLVDRIGSMAEAGAGRFYVRLVDMTDIAHLELIAEEVLPKVIG